jgi:hypothetical protein
VYGAEKAILEEKSKNFNNSGKTAEQYFKDAMGGGSYNNVSNMSLQD